MCFPRLAALAERGWSNPKTVDFKSFFERLKEFRHFYELLELNYCKNEFEK